jgi:hypothetical protein
LKQTVHTENPRTPAIAPDRSWTDRAREQALESRHAAPMLVRIRIQDGNSG